MTNDNNSLPEDNDPEDTNPEPKKEQRGGARKGTGPKVKWTEEIICQRVDDTEAKHGVVNTQTLTEDWGEGFYNVIRKRKGIKYYVNLNHGGVADKSHQPGVSGRALDWTDDKKLRIMKEFLREHPNPTIIDFQKYAPSGLLSAVKNTEGRMYWIKKAQEELDKENN